MALLLRLLAYETRDNEDMSRQNAAGALCLRLSHRRMTVAYLQQIRGLQTHCGDIRGEHVNEFEKHGEQHKTQKSLTNFCQGRERGHSLQQGKGIT